MSASVIIFYLISAVIVGGGLFAVLSRKIFRAAIFLLFSLIGVGGLYFYLNWEFLAAVQIVVYVGGIVVLIIFSVLLTHRSGVKLPDASPMRLIFSGLATLIACVLTMLFIKGHEFVGSNEAAIEPSTKNIGRQMLSYTDFGYSLPFEVVSILLLSAMIGCIVIAIKAKPKE